MLRFPTLLAPCLALTFALSSPARASDDATAAARTALAEKADAPAELPELPSFAADRAVLAQGDVAHGARGDAARAAHAAAGDAGRSAEAHAMAAERAAQAAAAKDAREDARGAAAQARADRVKKEKKGKGRPGGGS
jgi:hypothetical protein